MNLSILGNAVRSGVKGTFRVKECKKAAPNVTRSVREEVAARRKKQQKSFSIINIIKTDIENRINEKIVDILGLRF